MAALGNRVERGAVAVELGLLLPLLLTLLLGIAEFGYLFNQQISVTQAAREGAREYALHHGESTFNLNAVVQAAAPAATGVTAISAPGGGTCPSGDTVTVTATKTYTSLTGWFDGILPDDITVTGRGAMRCGG